MTKRKQPDGEAATQAAAKPAKQRKQHKKIPKQQRVGNFRRFVAIRRLIVLCHSN